MLRSLVFKRFAHCVGCGNDLVFPLSKTRNFPQTTSKWGSQSQENEKLDQLYGQMSSAQREALQWGNNGGDIVEKHVLDKQIAEKKANEALHSNVCKHCVMARSGSTNEVVVPTVSTGYVGRLFHVIDALDFPLGIPTDLNWSKGDMFVVNRCDLLVPRASLLPQLKKYFMETAFTGMGISEDQVVLTSATMRWHLKKLSEAFSNNPKLNYFVGPTNSGKSALVHALAGVSQKNGATTWPLPYTTQRPVTLRATKEFRGRSLMDMPSTSEGDSVLPLILPSALRKVCAGTRMTKTDPKYVVPKIPAKTGQVVSIGGLVALEFPPLPTARLPVHVFAGIGGLGHTDFGHAFRDMSKLEEINNSTDPSQMKLRMHDQVGLKLHRKLSFAPVVFDPNQQHQQHQQHQQRPRQRRQSVVIKGLGYLQPFLFGQFPENYEVTVWAPEGTDVAVRPEVLSYLY